MLRTQVEESKRDMGTQSSANEETRRAAQFAYEGLESRLKDYVVKQEETQRVQLEARLDNAGTALRALMHSLVDTAKQEVGASGGSSGFASGGGGPRDRNPFDARDYKIHDLESNPTLASSKKWKHDVELFVDTFGPSWTGAASLLRHCRLIDSIFDRDTGLSEVIAVCTRIEGKEPLQEYGFEFEAKADALYKLLMPRLNVALATEFRQIGSSNGFELYRQIARKLEPPKSDNTFTLQNELRGLG